MPAGEDVESNIGSNDAGDRNYTEFSRLLRNGQHLFRGSLRSEYGAADIESTRDFTDEEYDTDDGGAPEWSQLGLDTSGWEYTLYVTLVVLILVALVVSVVSVLVRIS
jgi:hypothetical protein